MSLYDQASRASKDLTDALYRELSTLLPTTDRNDADTWTTFGATGHSKYVFVKLSKKSATITVFFKADADAPPTQLPDMPAIKMRDTMRSDWAKITPYSITLNRESEVAPVARFLIGYSLPRAVSKRGGTTRSNEREIKLPEEVPAGFFNEGHATQITVNRYERDPQARAACLRHHGTSCAACGKSMEEVYGDIAHGFIHVHHLVPLSARRSDYVINPKLDLVPLCPNCHAVTHLADPPLSLGQLKIMLRKSANQTPPGAGMPVDKPVQ